jgi:hypothetical protein
MTATKTTPRTWTTGEIVTAALLNTHLRDNLDWLFGRPQANESDFDGTFSSTSSSSFTDTGANADITTTGGRVMVVVFGSTLVASSSTTGYLTLYEDGVNKGDATLGMQTVFGNGIPCVFAIIYITPTAPTAAAHSWKLYARSSNNTNLVSVTQYQMWALEIGA